MGKSTFDRISKICLAMPGAESKRQGDHASFLVRKKVFAYYLANHHGDGIVSLCAKVLPGDNTRLIAADPSKFYSPPYIGPRGWVGLRLDVGEADWDEVRELVTGSWLLTAPKRLAATAGLQLGEASVGKQLRADNVRRVVRDKE